MTEKSFVNRRITSQLCANRMHLEIKVADSLDRQLEWTIWGSFLSGVVPLFELDAQIEELLHTLDRL